MSNKFEILSAVALEEGLVEHGKMLTARNSPRGEHHSKRVYARKIGLVYWPALIAPTWGDMSRCDPKAFLAFEKFQASKGVPPWGTKDEKAHYEWARKYGAAIPWSYGGKSIDGQAYKDGPNSYHVLKKCEGSNCFETETFLQPELNRGGWDSCGHWGASPDFVKKAWFAAGCRESGKLFLQFSAGVIAKKGDSVAFFQNYLRGSHWISHGYTSNSNPQHGWAGADIGAYGWSRKALATLGRLSPEARHWATKGVKGTHEKRVRIRDLNWTAVRHLEDLRRDSSPEALRERQAVVPRGMAFVLGGLPHNSIGNNPGFVQDKSDGVTIVTAEKPSLSVMGCTVFAGETVVDTTEKPKKMYLACKGDRTYHCNGKRIRRDGEWRGADNPREALREAIVAWRKQDEAAALVRDRFKHLLRDDVTILITREDSYRAGNCVPGTEAWIDSTNIGHGRWCVPASALLVHADQTHVANVLAVANRAAGIYLAAIVSATPTRSRGGY